MRVLIVDDEPLGRRGVRICLRAASDVEVIGECSTGKSAIQMILRKRPDVVFLDIQMPDMSGCAVVSRIPREICPLVIFVTAYDEHALLAFRLGVIDYLLKPFDDDRFSEALNCARKRLQEKTAQSMVERLHAMLAVRQPDPRYRQKFVIKNGARKTLISVHDISWIQASGDYATLHADGKTFLVRETLDALQRELDPEKFARVHRSAIVAAAQIAEVRSLDTGDMAITLHDGSQLRASRRYRNNLQK
jgi:two-component system LytT family response regulator